MRQGGKGLRRFGSLLLRRASVEQPTASRRAKSFGGVGLQDLEKSCRFFALSFDV
jgi:hypothetical protein